MATTFTGRLASFKLGRFELDQPIARFSQATQGDHASEKYDGLIGGEILQRFKVVLDYSRRQMVLEPNADFAKSFEMDMSGIALVVDGNELLVDDVAANSPAAEAGVQGGDEGYSESELRRLPGTAGVSPASNRSAYFVTKQARRLRSQHEGVPRSQTRDLQSHRDLTTFRPHFSTSQRCGYSGCHPDFAR